MKFFNEYTPSSSGTVGKITFQWSLPTFRDDHGIEHTVKDANRAWHGDHVKLSDDGVVQEIVHTSRNHDRVIGYIKLNDKQKYGLNKKGMPIYMFYPLSEHYPPMLVACSAAKKYGVGTSCVYILAKFMEWTVEQKLPRGQCEDILGVCGDPFADVLARVHYHRLWDCNSSLTKEIDTMMEETYLDLTHENVFSIDPPGCVDIDDAIHIKCTREGIYEIGIHIANVTRYVHKDSTVDKEAQHRCYTTYLPHKQVPILPEALSHRACSLQPFEDRYTLSCILEWSHGNVVTSKFASCKINSKGALTYDDVDANRIENKRIANDIKLLSDLFDVRGDSHKLIEKLMLLANAEAAKQLMATHGGGLLRKHEHAPTASPGLKDSWLDSLWSQHAQPAEYVLADSNTPLDSVRHGSLGLDLYTHFTSPIRRYADQIVHRMLKQQLLVNDIPTHVIERLNQMQKRHRRFQRDLQILQVGCSLQNDEVSAKEYRGVILPFRFSESKQRWKIDVAVPELKMVYPLSWINEKTKWLFKCEMTDDHQTLAITNNQTGEKIVLKVGQAFMVRLVYRHLEPVLHKKCLLISDTVLQLLYHQQEYFGH